MSGRQAGTRSVRRSHEHQVFQLTVQVTPISLLSFARPGNQAMPLTMPESVTTSRRPKGADLEQPSLLGA